MKAINDGGQRQLALPDGSARQCDDAIPGSPFLLRPVFVASLLIVPGTATHAQAIKCSAFLHNGDGSWRSFENGTIIGSHGPMRIEAGDIFRRDAARNRADVAKILDSLCG